LKKVFHINLKKAAFKLREAAKKYSYKDTEYFHSYYGAWDRKEIMPKYILGEGAQGSFEGITVTLPEKYDEYLTRLYGDYMTPPPPEKQVSHHYCDIIDLDRSYKEYLSEDGVIVF
jgi:lipopolysaccharide cholinephosphotransferase